MPYLKRGDASIYYEEFGSGYPVFIIAPGSLGSSIDLWRRPAAPFNAIDGLQDDFRVIAMDQRNAGRSWAPISADDGWSTYTADHVALLDHLGIERCHYLGQCIGAGGFAFGLLQAVPERISAAVLMQPSGRIGPAIGPSAAFRGWRDALKEHPEATPEVLASFEQNIYRNDFVYSVTRDFVPTVQTPLLVLAGNDEAHPDALSEEIVRLAPNVEFIPEWKQAPHLEPAVRRIREFLLGHVPAKAGAAG